MAPYQKGWESFTIVQGEISELAATRFTCGLDIALTIMLIWWLRVDRHAGRRVVMPSLHGKMCARFVPLTGKYLPKRLLHDMG